MPFGETLVNLHGQFLVAVPHQFLSSKALAELLSQKEIITEDELIEFLLKPENRKSLFS
jgi:hypothetical protein